MWPLKNSISIGETESVISAVVEKVVRSAMKDAESALKLTGDLTKLKKDLETLKIEKDRKEEEFKTREREIEHKVGLERKRQEFEVGAAKREALVTVREENLKADRSRLEEQMKFQNDRFTSEVSYLKDMMGQMLERLPSANIEITRGTARRGK